MLRVSSVFAVARFVSRSPPDTSRPWLPSPSGSPTPRSIVSRGLIVRHQPRRRCLFLFVPCVHGALLFKRHLLLPSRVLRGSNSRLPWSRRPTSPSRRTPATFSSCTTRSSAWISWLPGSFATATRCGRLFLRQPSVRSIARSEGQGHLGRWRGLSVRVSAARRWKSRGYRKARARGARSQGTRMRTICPPCLLLATMPKVTTSSGVALAGPLGRDFSFKLSILPILLIFVYV